MNDAMWNKFGTIKDGRIEARFYMRSADVIYATGYAIYNREPVGDKFDLPMQATVLGNKCCVIYNGEPLAYLPSAWTQFVHQVATRGPISGSGFIQWLGEEKEFKVRFDIEEPGG